ncbi:MAG: hypothetical protein ACRDUY_10820, partial [Nitriliruptorales bacterium]
ESTPPTEAGAGPARTPTPPPSQEPGRTQVAGGAEPEPQRVAPWALLAAALLAVDIAALVRLRRRDRDVGTG